VLAIRTNRLLAARVGLASDRVHAAHAGEIGKSATVSSCVSFNVPSSDVA
jgi:hypothetical protein